MALTVDEEYDLMQKLMGPFPRYAIRGDGTQSTDVLVEYLPKRKNKNTQEEAYPYDARAEAAITSAVAKKGEKGVTEAQAKDLDTKAKAAKNTETSDWEDVPKTKATAVAQPVEGRDERL